MTTLTRVTKTKNGAFQAEFSAIILKPNTTNSALALLNIGDSRFRQLSKRMAWITVTPDAISKYFGIDISHLRNEESIELNIENPKIEGLPLNVQIQEFTQREIEEKIEKTTSDKVKASYQYLLDNALSRAKQIKTDEGTKYFIKDGQFIFSISSVVLGEPKHIFITDAKMVSEEELVNSTAVAQQNSVNLVG
jgi:hypothetical protein